MNSLNTYPLAVELSSTSISCCSWFQNIDFLYVHVFFFFGKFIIPRGGLSFELPLLVI